MTNKMIWLWLSLLFGAGNKIYKKLYDHFGSVQDIYDCDDADVELIPWLKDHERTKILDKGTRAAELVAQWCEKYDVDILTPDDDKYPLPLRALEDFPAALYCIGTLPDFQKKLCISVVGSRDLSANGRDNAYNLGYGLTKGGALVVSGMAKGIDCTAQKGALYAGGSTIAVLGCGINYIYPKENRELYEKILNVGAVLTEYAPNTPPNAPNFPIRNRIISGLSSATVVVEAGMNSGSLITARYARQQNKEVFAYPGKVGDHRSDGNNGLLRNGALAATSATDVLEYFLDVYTESIDISASKKLPDRNGVKNLIPYKFKDGFLYERTKRVEYKEPILPPKEIKPKVNVSVLSDNEKLIYDSMLPCVPVSANDLAHLGISSVELNSMLTVMELKGVVSSAPGGYYLKK